MLSALHIKNYILIDSLDVKFPEGLVIITGQTGAGKSILLGALSLLMGAKADAAVIKEGADSCVVEAEFDIFEEDEFIRSLLEENDVDWENGHLIIRRVVNASGRSRSFVNDCPVQVGVLSSLSTHLIDVHSQHQSLLLTDRNFQLSILDRFAGNGQLLQECKDTFREMQSIKAEVDTITAHLQQLSGEREYTRAQLNQLEAARLKSNELEELEAEQKQLANAELIKESLAGVQELFESGQDEGRAVIPALKEAQRLLTRISDYVPDAAQLASRLESSRIELDDVLSEVQEAFSSVDAAPQRLQEVEERMSLIYGLLNKHNCKTVDELIAIRNSFANALYDSASLVERMEVLSAALAAKQRKYLQAAEALHASREQACEGFSARIEESIHFLELENAVFKAEIHPAPQTQTGKDGVAFLFSASGRNPVELAKCASGGEVSRIMLCLKALMAEYTKMPTMIFDEIDSGVSGSVADKMGSMICGMGEMMQVFAITHLPQVAAKGRAHYLVSKTSGSSVTSSMSLLDNEGRIRELARMLSGSTVTEAAIANAKALLFQ